MSVSLHWMTLFVPILLSSAASVPSCELTDSKCLIAVGQSVIPVLIPGIPDLGTAVLDSLHLDKVKVDLAGLKLAVRNAEITGLKASTIDKINVKLNKKTIQVVYHCDAVMTGKYKASGQLLILPISGDGDMTFTLNNLEVSLNMPFEFIKNADGQDVIDLKSFTLKYEVKDGATFALTNLFNGNKELSEAMLLFMNQNWKIITQEFGEPILVAGHKIIFDAIKKYVATQPIQLPS